MKLLKCYGGAFVGLSSPNFVSVIKHHRIASMSVLNMQKVASDVVCTYVRFMPNAIKQLLLIFYHVYDLLLTAFDILLLYVNDFTNEFVVT